jgi:hypothetical protein
MDQMIARRHGQQVGYTSTQHVISWRFLVTGLLFAFAGSGKMLR